MIGPGEESIGPGEELAAGGTIGLAGALVVAVSIGPAVALTGRAVELIDLAEALGAAVVEVSIGRSARRRHQSTGDRPSRWRHQSTGA